MSSSHSNYVFIVTREFTDCYEILTSADWHFTFHVNAWYDYDFGAITKTHRASKDQSNVQNEPFGYILLCPCAIELLT